MEKEGKGKEEKRRRLKEKRGDVGGKGRKESQAALSKRKKNNVEETGQRSSQRKIGTEICWKKDDTETSVGDNMLYKEGLAEDRSEGQCGLSSARRKDKDMSLEHGQRGCWARGQRAAGPGKV